MKDTFLRVDEAAMLQVLESNKGTIAEIILRLAWCLGLIPDEMHELMWNDVDFTHNTMRVGERTIPMDEETAACLLARANSFYGRCSEYIVITDLRRTRMHRVYIFRFAKEALNKAGIYDVTMMDLRHDFIVRQLEKHSKAYVARICGLNLTTIDSLFMKYVENPYVEKKTAPPLISDEDLQKVQQIIQKEGPSPVGLVLWMTWKQQLKLTDIISLTWEDVDFKEDIICVRGQQVPMDKTLQLWLFQLSANKPPHEDPHILLTPQSRRPYDIPRISRMIKGALVKGGLENVSLFDLIMKGKRMEKDQLLLENVQARGFIRKEEAMKILEENKGQAWERLNRLTREGKLIRVGLKYYLPGTVVSPENQYDVIKTYLENVGSAYRKELAEVLRVDVNQCGWILKKFVDAGKLVRSNQMYSLPKDN